MQERGSEFRQTVKRSPEPSDRKYFLVTLDHELPAIFDDSKLLPPGKVDVPVTRDLIEQTIDLEVTQIVQVLDCCSELAFDLFVHFPTPNGTAAQRLRATEEAYYNRAECGTQSAAAAC